MTAEESQQKEGGLSSSSSPTPSGASLKLPARDFNPYRAPATDRASRWVHGIALEVEKREERKRKRRPKDQASFDDALRGLLSDIALSVLRAKEGSETPFLRVYTGHRNPSRYSPCWTFGRAFGGLLKELEKMGLVVFHRGGWTPEDGKHSGAVRGTKAFWESLQEAGLAVDDFKANLEEFEPVRLRSANGRNEWGRKQKGQLIDYRESRNTRRWREELKRANRYLEGLSLSCSLKAYPSGEAEEEDEFSSSPSGLVAVDPLDRAVYRVWNNGTWKDGGRLYGSFWLPMPKKIRRQHLRIGGGPVAHCDFGQLFVRLAYAHQGKEPPEGDLYDIPGWEAARDVVKAFLNASFYPRGRPDALPQGARAKLPDGLKGATGKDLSKALEERHPALAPLFGTGIGFHLLGLEGDITLATLSLAEEAGLSVLPVHDCCLCPLSEAEAVRAIMEEAYRRVAKTGDCPVVVS